MSVLRPTLIIAVRHRLGVSQERMSQLLGVSFVSVNRWENAHSAPSGMVADMYRAFDTALQRGAAADAILTAAEGDRGKFLFELFSMAHGPGRNS